MKFQKCTGNFSIVFSIFDILHNWQNFEKTIDEIAENFEKTFINTFCIFLTVDNGENYNTFHIITELSSLFSLA